MLDQPLVNGRVGPGVVNRTGGLEVGDSDVVEEGRSAGRSRSRDDIVLFQPGSELVVVPGGKDVVLGVVELLGSLGRVVGSLRRKGLVAG